MTSNCTRPTRCARRRARYRDGDDPTFLPVDAEVSIPLSTDLAQRIRQVLEIDGEAGRDLLLTAAAKNLILGNQPDHLAASLGITVRHAFRLRKQVKLALANAVAETIPDAAVGENLFVIKEAIAVATNVMFKAATNRERLQATLALSRLVEVRHSILTSLGVVDRAKARMAAGSKDDGGAREVAQMFQLVEGILTGKEVDFDRANTGTNVIGSGLL